MIKAIAFDLDGVYFSSGAKEFVNSVSKKYDVRIKKVEEFFFRSESMRSYKMGRISGEEFWSNAIKFWGIDTKMQDLLKILAESYEINENVKKVCQKLKGKYKIIVCSNNFKERVYTLSSKFNFLRDFDIFVFSYEFGKLKPKLLDVILDKLNIEPNELILVDDSLQNIYDLKKAGFGAVYFTSADEMIAELRECGVEI